MDLIDLIEETPDSLYSYLTSNNYEVIDNRPKGGSLWLVGGAELRPLINELRQKGITFQFTAKGVVQQNIKQVGLQIIMDSNIGFLSVGRKSYF